jgi:hypothetical protein
VYRAGSSRDRVTAIGTSTQSKETNLQRCSPPAISRVYSVQSRGTAQYSEESPDKGLRDRSLHIRRIPTHYVFQTYNARVGDDRQRRRRGRAQGPRRAVSVLSRMWKRCPGPLTPQQERIGAHLSISLGAKICEGTFFSSLNCPAVSRSTLMADFNGMHTSTSTNLKRSITRIRVKT